MMTSHRSNVIIPRTAQYSSVLLNSVVVPHNKKYHSGIRGIYITNTSTTMVFANEKTRFTTITVPRLLLPFP